MENNNNAIMEQIRSNQKKNRTLLIFLFLIIILMLGTIIYLLVTKNDENVTNNQEDNAKVEDRTLTVDEFINLDLLLSKPSNLYGPSFKYCRGNEQINCADDKLTYYVSVNDTNQYQTLESIFDSVKIEDGKLIAKLYLYNYEQQGLVYCNAKEYTYTHEITQTVFAKQNCSPYTYTFNVTNSNGQESYKFISVE